MGRESRRRTVEPLTPEHPTLTALRDRSHPRRALNTLGRLYLAFPRASWPLVRVVAWWKGIAIALALAALAAPVAAQTVGVGGGPALTVDVSSALSGGTITGSLTCQRDGIGTTSTDCFVATNTAVAAPGAQQWSPRVHWTGQGWKTNATAASQTVDWIAELQPVQAAAAPFANLVFSYQVAGGGYTNGAVFSNNYAGISGTNAASLNLPQGSAGGGSLGPITPGQHINITNGGSTGAVLGFGTYSGGADLGLMGVNLNGFSGVANYTTANQATALAAFGTGDASGTNIAGGDTTIHGGRSTGNAAGGTITFQTSPAGGGGGSVNALVTADRIGPNGGFYTGSAVGTDKGANTINISGQNNLFFDGLARIYNVVSDFSTASTTLVTVTGLTWTMPANKATNVPFRCVLYVSQATAAAANLYGVQGATTAPTNLQVSGLASTAAGTVVEGTATITTTTATTVVTATPSATGTIFRVELDGFLEAPSNASPTVLNVMIATGNASDSLTAKRGSFCTVN